MNKTAEGSNVGVRPDFRREDRYFVLKRIDMECLTQTEKDIIGVIAFKVQLNRAVSKPQLKCVVVEHDWPEYEPTWKAIEERMKA